MKLNKFVDIFYSAQSDPDPELPILEGRIGPDPPTLVYPFLLLELYVTAR